MPTILRAYPKKLPSKNLTYAACASDTRQMTVDSNRLIFKLADVNVYDRPSPAAIAALAMQLFDCGGIWKGSADVQ